MDNTQFDVPQATPLPVNSIYTVDLSALEM